MYYSGDERPFEEPIAGIHYKTLAHGPNTSIHEFHLSKGAEIPMHQHPHEQTGYMVSGKMNITINGETFMAVPGCSWSIPGNVDHKVEVLEDCVVVEVFSPAREDYL